MGHLVVFSINYSLRVFDILATLSLKGQLVGLTQRNYKRVLGRLLETHWELQEIEIRVKDKTYDPISGQHYFEDKVIKMKIGATLDVQWIKERISEAEMLEQEKEDLSVQDVGNVEPLNS